MELTISSGRGYVRSEENKKLLDIRKVGVIPIDSIFSPIERISYDVESARVGQDESYDKLILNVWTNGSIKPEEAIAFSFELSPSYLYKLNGNYLPFGCHAWYKYEYENFWKQHIN